MNKHFLGQFRLAAIGAIALLLTTIVLIVMGQAAFVYAFLAIVVLYSFAFFAMRTTLESSRASGSADNHSPFVYRVLYSMVDSRPSHSAQEEIERSQDELKPFVFKEMPRTDD